MMSLIVQMNTHIYMAITCQTNISEGSGHGKQHHPHPLSLITSHTSSSTRQKSAFWHGKSWISCQKMFIPN
jgi:hypothetical protein